MNESENTPIQALTHLNTALETDSVSADAVRIEDPIVAIESSLTDFVKDSFKHIQENRVFEAEVKEAILARLSEANIKQLMDFYGMVQGGNTGAMASLVNPVIGVQATRIQAAAENHTAMSGSAAYVDEKLFKKASKDVLQGIVQLNQILDAIGSRTVTAEVVDEKPKA